MAELQDIHSLTEFHRHSKAYARQLAKTGRPALVTVDRECKLIIQDAAAYRRLVRRAAMAQSLTALGKRLGESRNAKEIPLSQWDDAMRKKYCIESGS